MKWYYNSKFVVASSLSTVCLIVVWFACSTGGGPRFITARELSSRLDLRELTPMEIKRFEKVVNNEVSPCGDDVTLAEALFNPDHCPIAPLAGRFVTSAIMDDYNVEEISASYLARYAAIKGISIPKDGSPRIGAEKPVATIVVFSDFECPFCAKTANELSEILRRFPDRVAVVFKHFPLSSHPVAMNAARASFAAQRQERFWEMHDTLFSAIGSPLNQERIELMATGLGLDMDQFREDVASPAATAAIAADKMLAKKLGVNGTPTIFINGRMLEGGVSRLSERLSEEFLRSAQ